MRVRWFALGWTAVGLLACDFNEGEAAKPEASASVAASKTSSNTKSVVEGVVVLAEGAALPSYTLEAMEKRVLTQTNRATWPAECTPPKIADRQPVRIAEGGDGRALSGVMVAASSFKGARGRAPQVFDVAVDDCRLKPSLVVAMKGDSLRLLNRVNFPFMPSYGPGPFLRTLMPSQSEDVKLDKAGVDSVLCGFTAPCGRTDVVVLNHSLYVVTDAKGHFRIEDFPADQAVKLNAWHPLFKEQAVEVTVHAGETKQLEIVLTPMPPAPPAPVTAAPAAGVTTKAP